MRDGAFTHDVFLSDSSKDKAVVRPLAERLRQDGRYPKTECRSQKFEVGTQHSAFILQPLLCAFGSDWAQLEAGTCGRGNWWERRLAVRDPLNKERRFIPLRLDDAPPKGSLAQFLYVNWRPANREQEAESAFAE